MASFRLVAGTHSDEEGNDYKAGDIVESDKPLDEVFANKFERVPDTAAALSGGNNQKKKKGGAKKTLPGNREPDNLDQEMDTEPKDPRLPIEAVKQQEADRQASRSRDAHSSLNDENHEDSGSEEEAEPEEATAEQEPVGSQFGDDATDRIKGAKESGLRVFSNTDGFTVVDEKDLETPLHDKPLANKREAQQFVQRNRK